MARRFALPFWVGINTLIAGITIFSAYGGDIDSQAMPFASLALLTFPIWFVANALLLIANATGCRPLALVNIASAVITMPGFLAFCPLNPTPRPLTQEQQRESFKIMSYNTLSFVDSQRHDAAQPNRTMHTILSSGADAVVLLEYENQGPLSHFVPQSQIDSLKAIYPYFARGARGTVMYSRRPILHIIPPENVPQKGSIEAFRTSAPNSKAVNVFAVHLESIGLDDADKQLYSDLTDRRADNTRSELRDAKHQLVPKLYRAFVNRANQAKMLRAYVEYLGGDAIVCGDFNDVPTCRAIHILQEGGMHDVYSAVGRGWRITYNDPRFCFRIDHMLWRGDLIPHDIHIGHIPSSDHYPVTATFYWPD